MHFFIHSSLNIYSNYLDLSVIVDIAAMNVGV